MAWSEIFNVIDYDGSGSLNNYFDGYSDTFFPFPVGDTKIRFCLTAVNRVSSALSTNLKSSDYKKLQLLSYWDNTKYLNIHIVNSVEGSAGHANIPEINDELQNRGLIIDYNFFEKTILGHEIGHTLGLLHTFSTYGTRTKMNCDTVNYTNGTTIVFCCDNDDCSIYGDQICDTPPDMSAYTDCIVGGCDGYGTLSNNFMDYVKESKCSNGNSFTFTDGQIERMRNAITTYYPKFIEQSGCSNLCTENSYEPNNTYSEARLAGIVNPDTEAIVIESCIEGINDDYDYYRVNFSSFPNDDWHLYYIVDPVILDSGTHPNYSADIEYSYFLNGDWSSIQDKRHSKFEMPNEGGFVIFRIRRYLNEPSNGGTYLLRLGIDQGSTITIQDETRNVFNSISPNSILPSQSVSVDCYLGTAGSTNQINFGDGTILNIQDGQNNISHIYANEGIYTVRMLVDGDEISRKYVQVKSCDWISYVTGTGGYREPKEDDCAVIKNGVSYLPRSLSDQNYYWSSHANFRNFNINGDKAILEARVRNNRDEGGISCYDTQMILYGEKGRSYVTYMDSPSCNIYTSIGAGTTSRNGSNHNLSALSKDLNDWHTIRLVLKDQQVSTYYDGEFVYSMSYDGEIGNITGIKIVQKGSGKVDWVRLYDSKFYTLLYQEDFNSCQANCSGSDCESTLAINRIPIEDKFYQAAGSITSSGRVTAGSDVIFTAGESVTLNAGFQVESGAQFIAQIEPCVFLDDNEVVERSAEVEDDFFVNSEIQTKIVPNPFTSQTTVQYYLPQKTAVQVIITDLNGQIVKILVNSSQNEGWYNTDFMGNNLSQGMYLLHIKTAKGIKTDKLILIK